jgi:hypothetical protein
VTSQSRQAMTGSPAHPEDAKEGGAAFAAPIENTGTNQRTMRGHIIVLPGGVLLVDESLSPKLRASLGTRVSGPIECKNGRP